MKMRKIIDAHHHIWNKTDVPWIHDEPKPRIFGPYESIRRDYPIDEFITDLRGYSVEKSVYVQCNWDPKRAVEETKWVQHVSNTYGFPHGIVAFIDLRSQDIEDQLDAHLEWKNVKGVRQQLHWHENPHWSYVSEPEMFNDPIWRRGMDAVARRGLSFDLQIFPSQMKAAAAFARHYPGTPLILNHAGMPEDRSPEGWALWKAGMAELAKTPNVLVKFSGLNTFEHACSVDTMRPIITESLELFGPKRCMYGSNFPIEKIWTSYGNYLRCVIDAVGPVSDADFDDIFYNTARNAYRL